MRTTSIGSRLVVFAVSSTVLGALACGGGGDDPVQVEQPCPSSTKPIATIQVTPASDTLEALGATVTLGAVAKDAQGATCNNVTFTWASSAQGVVSVNAAGVATAVANGTASVTATAGGRTGAVSLLVAQKVTGVTVTPATATIAAGATQQFTAAAKDANNNAVTVSFLWVSSNHNVAIIDQNGLATGVNGGSVTISAAGEGVPGNAALSVTGSSAPVVTQLAFTVQPTSATAGAALSPGVEIELRDAAGNRVTSARNTVTLGIGTNAGSGTLSGTKTVNAVNGVASFSGLAIDKAGTGYTLSATAGTLTAAVSGAFDISPGPASRLAFSTQPVAVIEGNSAFTAHVQITDAFGNVVPTATNAVTVELGRRAPFGGSARLLGTLTVTAAAGVATFSNLRVDMAGAGYTLNARSGSLQTAGSDEFRIKLTFTQIDVGGFHSCAVTVSNSAYCWGASFSGQLGIGTLGEESIPRLVSGLAITQISAGGSHTCGVTTIDEVYCWGSNGSGQVGNGVSGGFFPEPQLVTTPSGVRFEAVSAGANHTCASTTSASTGSPAGAYCWGFNNNSQLGDGGTTSQNAPTLVFGGLIFKRVSAGDNHSCAVATNDLAHCWGLNNEGQLGVGDLGNRNQPALVSTVGMAQAEVGGRHSCFRKLTVPTDIYCAGRNTEGQLGDASNTQRPDEVPMASQLTWSVLGGGSGSFHTCMLDNAGAGYCVGRGTSGELGNGGTSNVNVRVPVSGSHVFSGIAVGSNHTCAVNSTNGEAWCWGSGANGRLGNGSNLSVNRPEPVQVIQ